MKSDDFVGTWKMVGYHNRTVDGIELEKSYGPEFMGLIHFHPNGRMMVVIADGRLDLPAGMTSRPFSAYTGRWAFDGEILTNEIDESFLKPFIGSVQTREVQYENGRLSLIPPPIMIGGVMNYRELVWEKIL